MILLPFFTKHLFISRLPVNRSWYEKFSSLAYGRWKTVVQVSDGGVLKVLVYMSAVKSVNVEGRSLPVWRHHVPAPLKPVQGYSNVLNACEQNLKNMLFGRSIDMSFRITSIALHFQGRRQ